MSEDDWTHCDGGPDNPLAKFHRWRREAIREGENYITQELKE